MPCSVRFAKIPEDEAFLSEEERSSSESESDHSEEEREQKLFALQNQVRLGSAVPRRGWTPGACRCSYRCSSVKCSTEFG